MISNCAIYFRDTVSGILNHLFKNLPLIFISIIGNITVNKNACAVRRHFLYIFQYFSKMLIVQMIGIVCKMDVTKHLYFVQGSSEIIICCFFRKHTAYKTV